MTDEVESEVAQCRMPGCEERQEFPKGPCEACLIHSLNDYFWYRPMAEFPEIVPGWRDGNAA